ncbi:nitrilase-related carbon-nitrogen hydrolase [Sulfitobacter sp. AS92]|uniref:nitrilase-related carbon-nitrogen hydrolase n=1 Tax=Sulfitobacter sp. AS92 TaxID=3135783 RepID=UPI0031796732
MSDRFRLTLGQLNPTVGDLPGNAAQARKAWEAGRDAGAQMVALPEMFLTGHDAKALLRKPAFQRDVLTHLEALAAHCADGPALALGAPWVEGTQVYNAYLVLIEGKIAHRVLQHSLERGSDFDAAPISGPFAVAGLRIGAPIGADGWTGDVAETQAETGAELLLVPNAAAHQRGAMDRRLNHMVARVIETELPLIYLNMTGGQDERVYDGGSFALNPGGKLALHLPAFDDAIAHMDLARGAEGWQIVAGDLAPQPDALERDYRAMVVGLRDYVTKMGFTQVLIEQAEGNDTALTAALALDALGPENVRQIAPPAKGAAHSALRDSLAELGTRVSDDSLAPHLRGLMLRVSADAAGEMLLTAQNKSAAAVGQAAIPGDFNPIKDLYQTEVGDLCRWRNDARRNWMLGPGDVTPAPAKYSPEDSALDGILRILLDENGTVGDCVAAGYDQRTAREVAEQISVSQPQNHRSAPGPQLTSMRAPYPTAARWRDAS